MLDHINIQNYKSIRSVDFSAKRINLFIGKPNVGKSNILEAISLLNGSFGRHIRRDKLNHLFFDQDLDNVVYIKGDNTISRLSYEESLNLFPLINTEDDRILHYIDKDSSILKHIFTSKVRNEKLENLISNSIITYWRSENETIANSFGLPYVLGGHPGIKQYSFKKDSYSSLSKESLKILSAPYGENLFKVLKNNKDLRVEIANLFKEYNYDLVIDFNSDEAEIQKNVDGILYKIPYSLIADTLQRAIFHYAAIATNENATLLFEEPENHSFPPYVRDLALKMIESSSNQFFVATHSPYLFQTIISEAPKEEVAIFVVTLDNYETQVKALSEQEIADISNNGIDVFFNLDLFV